MREGETLSTIARKWAQGLVRAQPAPLSTALSAEAWTVLITALAGAGLFLTPDLSQELLPTLASHAQGWQLLLLTLPAATLGVCLLPAASFYVFSARSGARRWPIYGGHFFTFVAWFVIIADAAIYQRFGRHWDDIITYATQPHGEAAAGDATANIGLVLVLLFWSAIGTLLSALVRRGIIRALASRRTLARTIALGVGAFLLSALLAPLWLLPPLLPAGFGPRLYASLAVRPTNLMGEEVRLPDDPALRQLQTDLQKEYERLFPFLFRHTAPEQLPTTELESPPDIAIVVAESFRWQQLSPEFMPRLFAWSTKGLRADRHYAGSNHSEAGLFSLLYSESALRLNATLDHGTLPTLCQLVRASDYRCGYYTGHPKVWLRREEFLSEKTMDDFVQRSDGTWNDWDRNALDASSRHLADDKRRLSLTFLMSSHFEYRYPDKYRKHRPDSPPSTSWLPGRAKPSEFESSRNRYLNVTAYLDDLVTDYIESLGENTLVVFTGDHGESTGEDGRFGHGYGFSDLLSRVPFVIVGPGISPGVRQELSSHHDLLPTVLHALQLPVAEGALGRPLQSSSEPRSLLSTYTRHGRPIADGLLLNGKLRLKLRLDPVRPLVRVLGFEDPVGKPIAHQLTGEEREQLVRAFIEQLEASGRTAVGN